MANTITLADAEVAANSWQQNPPKPLSKAHLIPLDVLTDLLALEGVVDVRAYMGVNSENEQILMFVGVDEFGKDMTELIFSGTKPCPSDCDTTSPLYNP